MIEKKKAFGLNTDQFCGRYVYCHELSSVFVESFCSKKQFGNANFLARIGENELMLSNKPIFIHYFILRVLRAVRH
ncbi:hypothetical protein N483_00780 [Pseudoalteromonas luteoviolacea NCIMB 1944]|nr:hypothetical protein N483_00780 [Pseudoalteromonas luteoviolacea NCIMB 1944]